MSSSSLNSIDFRGTNPRVILKRIYKLGKSLSREQIRHEIGRCFANDLLHDSELRISDGDALFFCIYNRSNEQITMFLNFLYADAVNVVFKNAIDDAIVQTLQEKSRKMEQSCKEPLIRDGDPYGEGKQRQQNYSSAKCKLKSFSTLHKSLAITAAILVVVSTSAAYFCADLFNLDPTSNETRSTDSTFADFVEPLHNSIGTSPAHPIPIIPQHSPPDYVDLSIDPPSTKVAPPNYVDLSIDPPSTKVASPDYVDLSIDPPSTKVVEKDSLSIPKLLCHPNISKTLIISLEKEVQNAEVRIPCGESIQRLHISGQFSLEQLGLVVSKLLNLVLLEIDVTHLCGFSEHVKLSFSGSSPNLSLLKFLKIFGISSECEHFFSFVSKMQAPQLSVLVLEKVEIQMDNMLFFDSLPNKFPTVKLLSLIGIMCNSCKIFQFNFDGIWRLEQVRWRLYNYNNATDSTPAGITSFASLAKSSQTILQLVDANVVIDENNQQLLSYFKYTRSMNLSLGLNNETFSARIFSNMAHLDNANLKLILPVEKCVLVFTDLQKYLGHRKIKIQLKSNCEFPDEVEEISCREYKKSEFDKDEKLWTALLLAKEDTEVCKVFWRPNL